MSDAEIELEAIITDVRTGHLPLDVVVEELREEQTGDDHRRVEVLRRALARLDVRESVTHG